MHAYAMVKLVDAKLKGQLKLEPGAKVQVRGLENQKELNGLIGQLLQFDPVKMRWGVELEGGKRISLKMNNFLPVNIEIIPGVGPESAKAPAAEAATDTAPDVMENAIETAQPQGQPPVAVEASAPVVTAEAEAAASAEPVSGMDSAAMENVIETAQPQGERPVAMEASAPVATVEAVTAASAEPVSGMDPAAADEEWPVLPTSEATAAKMRSGCWFDGGSAAKRFVEQLHANDPALVSVCLVPPKRFNEDDAEQICDALEANSFCEELLASGHALSNGTCERFAKMLRSNTSLESLSVGDSSLGDAASILFDGLAQNTHLLSLDLEHKGLTESACLRLSEALVARSGAGAPPLVSLQLSRTAAFGSAPLSKVASSAAPAPRKVYLSECALSAKHGAVLGEWARHGLEDLDLRDNPQFGAEGLEAFFEALLRQGGEPTLRSLRLDGCSVGDDGLEAVADAEQRGLRLEELLLERCEVTVAGCKLLAERLRGRRFRRLSARANVIGDEGCALLARCAEHLDLSSTSLTGQVLGALGEHPLVSLELFSNPALGPSVSAWCASLQESQWQELEYLDLTGCALRDEGFDCVISTFRERPQLMPRLTCLCLGANETEADDETRCETVERLGEERSGRLTVKWMNA